MPVSGEPSQPALDASANLWVPLKDKGAVTVLDASGTVVHQIDLGAGSEPHAVLFDHDNQMMYVTLEQGNAVIKIDAETYAVVERLALLHTPRDMAFNPATDKLYITHFISPDDAGKITVLDLDSFTVEKTADLIHDPGPDTDASGRGLPNHVMGIAISPDGKHARIGAKKDNIFRGQYREGTDLTFEMSVRAMTSYLGLSDDTELMEQRVDINNSADPSAVTFSSLGDYVFISTQGTNVVHVLDAYSSDPVTSIELTGKAPTALYLDQQRERLWVKNFTTRTVEVYDVSDLIRSRGFEAAQLKVLNSVQQEKLNPVVLKGKQVFYDASDRRMSMDGYLSCATCHNEGKDDGRVWDVTQRGEGLRNTTTLIGKSGIGHGNVHFTGNFDEIQDFENDIREEFGGTGFISDDVFFSKEYARPLGTPKAGISPELDALAAYVSTFTQVGVSPYRDQNPFGNPSAGKQLFTALNCADCHSGPAFTNSVNGALFDVGTGTPASGKRIGTDLLVFDTQTLKGLWRTAPYLHDGSAATLKEVLTDRNASDMHGRTSALSDNELNDLIAYLMQIDDLETDNPSDGEPVTIQMLNDPETGFYVAGDEIEWRAEINKPEVKKITFLLNEETELGTDTDSTDGWAVRAPVMFSGTNRIRAFAEFQNGTKVLSAPLEIGFAGTEVSLTELRTFGEGSYSIDTLRTGLNIHTDTNYQVEEFPAHYAGAIVIQTPRMDRNTDVDTLISFRINQPATVLVGFDDSFDEPQWLRDFEKTTDTLFTSRKDLILYRRIFTEKEIVLGSNRVPSGRLARHMYAVLVSPNVVTTTSEDEEETIPVQMQLLQNYPNPFNPSTTIPYSVASQGTVRLEVYNLLGQKVATLVDGRHQAGSYQVTFDASMLSSGMYLYRLTMNGQQLSKRMLLIK